MSKYIKSLPSYLIKRYKGWRATGYEENKSWFIKIANEISWQLLIFYNAQHLYILLSLLDCRPQLHRGERLYVLDCMLE